MDCYPSSHLMSVVKSYPSGDNELYCEICGLRILLHLNPYSKIVISPGDEGATHSGVVGGSNVNVSTHDAYLDVYEDWLKSNDA